MDSLGYLYLTDFGISREYVKPNFKDRSGTRGYMAPEVLFGMNHSFPVDFYPLGIIIYECMLGQRPYASLSKNQLKQILLTTQISIHECELPNGWSVESADLVNKLLERKPEKRLGYLGIFQIKNHPWFQGFDWEFLRKKQLEAPFCPKLGLNYDKKHCSDPELRISTIERYSKIKANENYKKLFINFDSKEIPKEFIDSNHEKKYDFFKSKMDSYRSNKKVALFTARENSIRLIKKGILNSSAYSIYPNKDKYLDRSVNINEKDSQNETGSFWKDKERRILSKSKNHSKNYLPKLFSNSMILSKPKKLDQETSHISYHHIIPFSKIKKTKEISCISSRKGSKVYGNL